MRNCLGKKTELREVYVSRWGRYSGQTRLAKGRKTIGPDPMKGFGVLEVGELRGFRTGENVDGEAKGGQEKLGNRGSRPAKERPQ